MGEAEASQLEHIAEMPQGCGYRLIGNPIPIKIEQVGGQYVAEADLEVMLVTNGWGSTPEEARDELAGYLAAELKRLKSANQKFLSEFEAASQARLKEFLVEAVALKKKGLYKDRKALRLRVFHNVRANIKLSKKIFSSRYDESY